MDDALAVSLGLLPGIDKHKFKTWLSGLIATACIARGIILPMHINWSSGLSVISQRSLANSYDDGLDGDANRV